MCPTFERKNKGSFTAHEFPTGVNIIVIADVCVTGILVVIENVKYPLFYDHWPSNQLYKGVSYQAFEGAVYKPRYHGL